ncbi:MAG: glycoside hydrolase family 25 protein [Lachnospiraceae bacterium]|nr:glycoside hydrolase family 25 protein [Lachnospiraceae bacterium]
MAGFFDDQEREDKKAYKRTVIYFIAAVSLVMLLFLLVIYSNTREKQARERTKRLEEKAKQEEIEEQKLEDEALGVGEHNLTSEDLDFWEMYEKDSDKDSKEPSVAAGNDDLVDRKDRPQDEDEGSVSSNTTDRKNSDEDKDRRGNAGTVTSGDEDTDEAGEEEKPKEKEDDGKHIKAQAKGENATWYEIIGDLDKHGYDLKTNLSMDEENLEYKDKNITSKRGVDVSKYQGAIDWMKVRAAGIDFAMIRVGARGYGSGQLTLDDNFVINIMGAKAAGLDTGVYFFTQATTEDEAVEEGNFTVGALMNYGVSYPVAVDVEWIEGDRARTDELTPEERTALVIKYCDTVKSFGYEPIIYASRDMLIAGLLPDKLNDYDVWLSDDYEPQDGTDYPYRFSMWQYTKKGHVDGIEGEVDLNLRFINNKEK